jgi:hypothetical protein
MPRGAQAPGSRQEGGLFAGARLSRRPTHRAAIPETAGIRVNRIVVGVDGSPAATRARAMGGARSGDAR